MPFSQVTHEGFRKHSFNLGGIECSRIFSRPLKWMQCRIKIPGLAGGRRPRGLVGRGWSCERLNFLLQALVKSTRKLGISSYGLALPFSQKVKILSSRQRTFKIVGQGTQMIGMTLMVRVGWEPLEVQSGVSGNFLPAIHRCFADRAASFSSSQQHRSSSSLGHRLFLFDKSR